MLTVGSSLAVPATLDDANNLRYQGSNGAHHDGADTALWNPTLAGGTPAAPAAGQVLSVQLEGCAEPAPGGPPPLTQFHLQTLTPIAGGGGATVDVTSQPFDLPVCGAATPQGAVASGSTISTYQPTNMCASAGDYIDFNDEGGFDPQFYGSGVPYKVIGSVPGSTMSSYVDGNGTNNGDALSAMNVTATNGFATNANEELMLRVTLGTGGDSIPACLTSAGGSPPTPKPPPTPLHHKPGPGQPGGPPGVKITPRTEHVTKQRRVSVAIFCAQRTAPCSGTLSLATAAQTLLSTHFTSRADATGHIALRLSPAAAKVVRKAGAAGIRTTLTITLTGAAPVSGTITLIALR